MKLYNYSLKILYSTTILILGIISISWWYFVFSALDKKIKIHKSFISRAGSLKRKTLDAQQEYNQLKKQKKYLEHQYSILIRRFQGICNQQVLAWLINVIARHKIILKDYKPLKERDEGQFITYLYEFKLAGNFYSILKFFDQIIASPYLLKCIKCTLKKESSALSCVCILKLKTIR